MKILLSLFMLFTMFANGQNCDSILSIYKDRFDGKRKITIGFMTLTDGYFNIVNIMAEKVGYRIEFYISVKSESSIWCFEPGSKATFLFSDKTKASIISQQNLNCDGAITYYCTQTGRKTNSSAFNKMLSENIEAIRFFSTEGYFDVVMDEKDILNSENIKQALKCLVETK